MNSTSADFGTLKHLPTRTAWIRPSAIKLYTVFLLQRSAFAASMTVITSGVPLKYDVISLSINDLLLPFTGILILTFTLLLLFMIPPTSPSPYCSRS